MSQPTLAQSAHTLAAILGVIVQMSDDVAKAGTPLDAQGKLLRMQASIQKNAARVVPHVQVVLAAVEAEKAGAGSTAVAVDVPSKQRRVRSTAAG